MKCALKCQIPLSVQNEIKKMFENDVSSEIDEFFDKYHFKIELFPNQNCFDTHHHTSFSTFAVS
jgi:hypothetical protein